MKTITHWLLILSCTFATAAMAEGFYKWKDAHGNTQYGDQPPANAKAERMNMPKLTVIENYGEQWKPVNFPKESDPYQQEEKAKATAGAYTTLSFIAPKANQPIRANDGDVSAIISLKPKLKPGHAITFSIDGKEVAKGSSRTNNFTNLARGDHTINVNIINESGKVLKSQSVTFTVLRFSKLFKKNSAVKPATNNNVASSTPNQ
ncbi:hypothetical protein GCM10009133_32610 [Cocleimonas flava]|uniref:Uncharacterized protein DUF4124 n=1 Tax=Cocleimonas flava TaxID=634765 RepID=A0A4R1F4W7_9GAMM|nr:DUF4124 domain-containing protein [Cocleimonas flava]TCJ88893.1 uncharacterized protein DUF4124 [Cocleimonas flava]